MNLFHGQGGFGEYRFHELAQVKNYNQEGPLRKNLRPLEFLSGPWCPSWFRFLLPHPHAPVQSVHDGKLAHGVSEAERHPCYYSGERQRKNHAEESSESGSSEGLRSRHQPGI